MVEILLITKSSHDLDYETDAKPRPPVIYFDLQIGCNCFSMRHESVIVTKKKILETSRSCKLSKN